MTIAYCYNINAFCTIFITCRKLWFCGFRQHECQSDKYDVVNLVFRAMEPISDP